eukprot:gene34372-44099_t
MARDQAGMWLQSDTSLQSTSPGAVGYVGSSNSISESSIQSSGFGVGNESLVHVHDTSGMDGMTETLESDLYALLERNRTPGAIRPVAHDEGGNEGSMDVANVSVASCTMELEPNLKSLMSIIQSSPPELRSTMSPFPVNAESEMVVVDHEFQSSARRRFGDEVGQTFGYSRGGVEQGEVEKECDEAGSPLGRSGSSYGSDTDMQIDGGDAGYRGVSLCHGPVVNNYNSGFRLSPVAEADDESHSHGSTGSVRASSGSSCFSVLLSDGAHSLENEVGRLSTGDDHRFETQVENELSADGTVQADSV